MNILEKLDAAGVLEPPEISEDGQTLTLTEGCDLVYSTTLTKAEVYQLADELKAIGDNMTPV